MLIFDDGSAIVPRHHHLRPLTQQELLACLDQVIASFPPSLFFARLAPGLLSQSRGREKGTARPDSDSLAPASHVFFCSRYNGGSFLSLSLPPMTHH